MRNIVAYLLLFGMLNVGWADTKPDAPLVANYLKVSKTEDSSAALVESYAQQYGGGGDAEKKEQIRKYFSQIMGWDAVKDQYASIISETYTANELRGLIAFLSTPIGKSTVNKYQSFQDKLVALYARNTKLVAKQQVEKADLGENSSLVESASVLTTSDVEERDANGVTYFIGSIHNNGKQKARGVQVEVNLFDSGKFVDQYSTYVSGAIEPGGSRYFKISCGCKDNQPAKHDSYKIEIINGY